MASVLVLGAGTLQGPALLAAKNLKYTVICVDANENAPCVNLADIFEPIDLKDVQKIYDFAKTIPDLKAVFTAGTDFSTLVSYLAEKLNLYSHSFEAAQNASEKVRMRSCFKESEIPSPRFFRVREKMNKNELYSLAKNIGFPLVAKPVDNMGARACKMIMSRDELEVAVENAIQNSKTRTAIVEEFMDGDEYSIDALIYNGTMTITGFADRHIFFPPYFVELGHTMSSTLYKSFDHTSDNKINQDLNEKKRNELIATFALATKSLGLSCGAAKADIKYTSKGPMIGEIAARLSGGYMSGWTYPYASGCNLTEEALLLSLGKSPKYLEENRIPLDFIAPESLASAKEPFKLYELPCKRWSVERAWISIPGKVSKIIGLESILSNEFIKDVFVRSKEGDSVTFPKNNVEKCGNIISCADKREDAIFAAENAISEIVVRLEPSCKETDNFLQEDLDTLFPPSAFLCSGYNHILKEDESPTIPENESVVKYIPDSLKALFESEKKDWSYRTFKKTCILFDKIEKVHPVLDAKKFWQAALRAGLQGMLYVCDSSDRAVVGE